MGEGEGGKIWENGIETCIISCKKRIASPGSMQDTGCLGLVYWEDPEGWYGEGGGRGFQDGEHVYTLGEFMFRSDQSLSRVQPLATPWTAAYPAPPSMGFSRQEYWSGVPLPSPIQYTNAYIWNLERW